MPTAKMKPGFAGWAPALLTEIEGVLARGIEAFLGEC
jgi:hypothetical protein